jgi:UPF0176 protein
MRVAAFYRFTEVADPDQLRCRLQTLCDDSGLLGTILVAVEGVNGTLAGSQEAIEKVFAWLESELVLDAAIDARWTEAGEAPFRRMRVKVKNEIVTLGRSDIRPDIQTGEHIGPAEWNRLIDSPATLVIDTRNHYEIEIGSFPNAVDPGTDNFRQFVEFAETIAESDKSRPLAMFCTGGIRCEKAAALMLKLGFSDVYQLKGGILHYLENVAENDNRWNGECFVFDTRVAVDRDLAEGDYVQCHACRRPLSSEDLESPHYREGVSCPRCIGDQDEERAKRLEERRKQVALANERGEAHIGQRLD